jgi:hypothetical protein
VTITTLTLLLLAATYAAGLLVTLTHAPRAIEAF